jgi:hypothetical protein
MTSALLHASGLYAPTIAAALLMVRLGSLRGLLESSYRTRWCASCHRRITGRGCECTRER